MTASTTMFLIRRKSDGLYAQDHGWTDNFAKARMFKSVSGAKTSSTWGIWFPEPKATLRVKSCKTCSKYGGKSIGVNHVAHWDFEKKAPLEKDLPLEIIHAKVSITIK